MRTHRHPIGVVALFAVLLVTAAACSSARAATDQAAVARSGGGTATSQAEPSDAAKMVCGSEIRTTIATALSLPTSPKPTSTWIDDLYSCTYKLPDGVLVLSVKELPDDAAAGLYFAQTSKGLGAGKSLGKAGFQSNDGIVLTVKDNDVLKVDARRLPDNLGSAGITKNGFAYEISSNVLSCWHG